MSIRRAVTADAALLAQLATRTFQEAFADRNTPEDMALHIQRTFAAEHLERELRDQNSATLLAFVESGPAPVGYVKLVRGPAPDSVRSARPLELARLYVERVQYGTGAGSELMRAALDEAAKYGHDVIWLGVWEQNPRAIAFYRRWSFESVGTQVFRLGTDDQTDVIMARKVEGPIEGPTATQRSFNDQS